MAFSRLKLKARVGSGLAIGAALIATAFWMPSIGLFGILVVLCILGATEFYSMVASAGLPHFRILGTVGGVALITTTWVALTRGSTGTAAEWECVVLVCITVAVLVRLFPQKDNSRPIETMATTILGVMYVAFLLNFFTKLLIGWNGVEGRLLTMYVIVVVKCSDIGAYFVGCHMGRHKLFPRVSPAKTWEGFIGGMATSLVVSLAFYFVCKGSLTVVTLGLHDAVILGILFPVCGIVGDLSESLLKRAADVKDSGGMIQGMGGILDVIDSLLFAAPAMYVYARLFLERVTLPS